MDPAAAARYAGVAGLDGSRLRLQRGRDADIAFDQAGGRVYRFPRHPLAAADLPRRAALLGALPGLGVPTPRVVAADPGAPLGRAYLAMGLLPGLPLTYELADGLGAIGSQRLATDLARLLSGLRRATGAPGLAPLLAPARDREWWTSLAERAARALLHLLPPDSRARAQAELAAAVAAAGQAPSPPTLTHGDLGSAVLVEPETGRVGGVLGWAEAALGDPAVDLAGLSTGLTKDVLERLFRLAPGLRRDVRRAHGYAATTALQAALSGFEAGDLAAVAAGLETYR